MSDGSSQATLRREQTADPAALDRRQAMQKTRIGRPRSPPHPQPNEQENAERGGQFGEEINRQQRLDVFRRAILGSGEFCPHFLGPDRHDEEPERRIIEMIITSVGIRFWTRS